MKIRDTALTLHGEGEALSDHIRREKDFFEAHILDYLKSNYGEQTTILDIGANIGNHTVYFAEYFKYQRIIAFEPVPANLDLLRKNVAPYKGVTIVPVALSDYEGSISIQPNPQNMGASEINQEGSMRVIARTLDSYELYQCSLIKIDVEWHEPQVLAGATYTIIRNRPLILIEDANKEYSRFLPNYELVQAWESDKTYLYQWKGSV